MLQKSILCSVFELSYGIISFLIFYVKIMIQSSGISKSLFQPIFEAVEQTLGIL